MASKLNHALGLRNAMQDAQTTYIGGGARLRIYAGVQPAGPDTALSGQTLLAEFVCATPFASASSNGVLAPSLPGGVNAVATGTASFYRLWRSNGTTPCKDGSVGTSAADMILNSTSLVAGQAVSVTSWSSTDTNTGH